MKKKKGFLSWSGKLSREIIQLVKTEIINVIFKDQLDFFMSKEMQVGENPIDTIMKNLRKSVFTIICVTPENLENLWMTFEHGASLKNIQAGCVYVIKVGVSEDMISRLNNLFEKRQYISLDEDGIKNLVNAIAKNVLKQDSDIILESELGANGLTSFLEKVETIKKNNPILPNTYENKVKYVKTGDSNLSIPAVFDLYSEDLFFVGIDHSFILNLNKADSKKNFEKLIDSIVLADGHKRVRILISNIWDKHVYTVYGNLIQRESAIISKKDITNSLKNPESPDYIDKVILEKHDENVLKKIKNENLLEIRTIRLLLDTFVFIDGHKKTGLCYFSLMISPSGKNRPIFVMTKEDNSDIYETYHSFIEVGWSTTADNLWPPRV